MYVSRAPVVVLDTPKRTNLVNNLQQKHYHIVPVHIKQYFLAETNCLLV